MLIKLDDETFEQDLSDSVRKLLLRSRSQLNYVEQVLLKLVTCPNKNLTITEMVSKQLLINIMSLFVHNFILFFFFLQGQLKQWCRENEYCLRFCLEGIKDSSIFVSTKDIAEIESKSVLLNLLRFNRNWIGYQNC